MLHPKAVEWDEYFGMCALQERQEGKVSPGISPKMGAARISKLRQCRHGVSNVPVAESERVEQFLRHNQLSTLIEISHSTGIGHDKLKEVLYEGRRDTFFMFRTDAAGDSQVYYSVAEPEQNWSRKRWTKQQKIDRRAYVVRWMSYRGFIDPKFFHLPMNMKEATLTKILRDLYYREEVVGVRRDRRSIFWGDN